MVSGAPWARIGWSRGFGRDTPVQSKRTILRVTR